MSPLTMLTECVSMILPVLNGDRAGLEKSSSLATKVPARMLPMVANKLRRIERFNWTEWFILRLYTIKVKMRHHMDYSSPCGNGPALQGGKLGGG